ncbi:DUF2237 family protein [Leeuwenhoekiella nanhaiensis]|uniref:DUF2237 domain-containing protein n=1 Tax=Leeuwenhoekiella nanhaiensis TaxID=1655491 RepID=A0A2G1VTS5_9FLAO|nr:DUF2237 domain-containing protein [Leeuwenhoekiella nanhaiensis]PHQ30141.1 hypothetical protein CJ305_04030 [Leeuwenhoekiella nanhaiensis]
MEENPLNVYGKPLLACRYEPLTGYFRDGFCKTIDTDTGTHVVCAQVTEEFLNFSANRGNDLITPRPQWDFPGLKSGDFWCLCVSRWLEAEKAGVAPKLKLEACHYKTLEYTSLELLEQYALPE